jgi:hypothetical protein
MIFFGTIPAAVFIFTKYIPEGRLEKFKTGGVADSTIL